MVLFHGDKILLLKRDNDLWEFPGGGVDWGEDPKSAAIRETKEETTLSPEDVSFLTITSATYAKGEDEKHSIYIVYKGTTKSDRVIISKEHRDYRWLTIGETKFMKMALNAEPVLDLL